MRLRSRLWSRSFLASSAIGILVVASSIAALIATVRDPGGRARPTVPEPLSLLGQGEPEMPDPRTWLDPWLASDATRFEDVLDAIGWLTTKPEAGGTEGIVDAIARSIHDARERELATLVARAYDADVEAIARLRALAGGEAPARYASFALGAALGPSEEAAVAFEREARLYESANARRHVLETSAMLGDDGAIARLVRDPAYASLVDARFRYTRAEQRLDWASMLIWVGPAQYTSVSPTFVALGIASGIVWLFFLAYAGGVRSVASSRLALCVVALALGALSTVPTLVLSVWTDDVLGMHESDDALRGIAYFVVSVGLREELSKLLLFLPLAPIVIRRRDPLEMLVVAGCVGLGFAAEENVAYFAESAGGDAAGRFLTANFGHVVDTGLVGFALCRAWIEPERAKDFVLVLVAVVIGHGVYDALIVVPALEEWSALSATIYVAVAYLFFGELRKYASVDRASLPLTAIFALGLATLIGLALVASTWELGLGGALQAMLPGTVGALLFVVVFVRQIDEPLLP